LRIWGVVAITGYHCGAADQLSAENTLGAEKGDYRSAVSVDFMAAAAQSFQLEIVPPRGLLC
jgi:hypothetical protein